MNHWTSTGSVPQTLEGKCGLRNSQTYRDTPFQKRLAPPGYSHLSHFCDIRQLTKFVNYTIQ
jgi:hypothetical protein